MVESVQAAALDSPVFYYRTSAGAEIDLVIEGSGGERYALEIKRSSAPVVTRGFWSGLADLGVREAVVIYPGDDRIPLREGAVALGLLDALEWVRARTG